MSKRFAFAIGALLCLGLAAPAKADLNLGTSGSANAFWYSYEEVSDTSYRVTSWYVGVYSSTNGTWSDVYQNVFLCTARGEETPRPQAKHADHSEECTSEVSRYGFSDLEGETFDMDPIMLDAAHLDAHYDMWSYDAEGNPVGDPVSSHVVTDWTGTGDATNDRGASVYSSGCSVYVGTFVGASRSAEATATIDGAGLGETYDASLATSISTDVYQSC